MSDSLRGTVERLTYHNEESGYTVAQLAPDGKAFTVTVVGHMPGIKTGEMVELTGKWISHPHYGRQFQVERATPVLPATVAGIQRYLGSGLVKGIGPVMAQRIVRHFGLDTLQVIEQEPERLAQVPGIGTRRVQMIIRAWHEQQQIKEVMLFLQSHDVSAGLAVKIYKAYGDDAIEVVRNSPYRLAREIFGIGFITADRIARNIGVPSTSPERVAAGVLYVLSQAADEGHVYQPAQSLIDRSSELLAVPPELARQAILSLAGERHVQIEEQAGVPGPPPLEIKGESAVYLTPFYYAETGVANRLARLVLAGDDALATFDDYDWQTAFRQLQVQTRLSLSERQAEAVRTALTHRVVVLTGGPGTGKTTTVRSVIRLVEAAGRRALLASPTGRAAKRLAEATGRPAKTIHRLLEFQPGEGFTFTRDEGKPLEAELVVVDEASMLDLLLTNNLLKALSPGTHLLLVGDVDQLPSVGAGNVLHDLIGAIEAPGAPAGAAVVRLDTIFRQAADSHIITNAHRINAGSLPTIDNRNSRDFYLFKEEDPESAAATIVELVQERIPRRFGLSSDQIQVLSPMHRGAVGVGELNSRLQAALNPPAPGIPEQRIASSMFRPGDRVMQIRNNYDKEVYNGDMGYVRQVDLEEQTLAVRIDDRDVVYEFSELDELVHAYAISIHKAQGSEFPAVVVPLLTTHYIMLQRNLLYTAVTRAQRLVVLVGNMRALSIAVHNARAQQRFTGLQERLGSAFTATATALTAGRML